MGGGGVDIQQKHELIEALENQKGEINQIFNNFDQTVDSASLDNLGYINNSYDDVVENIIKLKKIDPSTKQLIEKIIFDNMNIIKRGIEDGIYLKSLRISSNILTLDRLLDKEVQAEIMSERYENSIAQLDDLDKKKKDLENKLNELDLLRSDINNKNIHEIFEDDSVKFKKIAINYEVAFYSIIVFLVFYFLGLTIYIKDIDLLFLHISFPEKIHGDLSIEFYIQKISLLILSTTLAAFLLKRSFMNRRLADEAYRTAKELDALPRYMEGMSEEMKEKIRFDLTYKYFGNGIHHESYTGGENLMHENIKANTDFIRAIKDAPTESSEK